MPGNHGGSNQSEEYAPHLYTKKPASWQDRVVETKTTKGRHEGLIFVSAPSKGIIEPGTKWTLRDAFLQVMADLHTENPRATFISPSLMQYIILPYMPEGTSHDYAAWREQCILVLQPCTKALVLPFEGWKESVGVNDEVHTAMGLHKPIELDIDRPQYNL